MEAMKILFLYGWQSTPGGVKPTYLREHGHEVLNPALPDDRLVRLAAFGYRRSGDKIVGLLVRFFARLHVPELDRIAPRSQGRAIWAECQ